METTNKNAILIKKASGETEPFSHEKLKQSLLNAGASEKTILKIVTEIESWIYSGVTTKKIYTYAFKLLRNEKTSSSLRYGLKKAIIDLGPTGYPFEILIGELFEHMGYKTEVGIVVEGKCVTHEMDVIATNNNDQQLVECKYHKDQGKQVSVQVPLYLRSRVNDIIDKRNEMLEFSNLKFTGWLITNTRFSSDSLQYGMCSGLKMLSWNFPIGDGLHDNIEKYKIYPITVLKNLKIKEKQYLLKEGIVTCKQLLKNKNLLNLLNLRKAKYDLLLKELYVICN